MFVSELDQSCLELKVSRRTAGNRHHRCPTNLGLIFRDGTSVYQTFLFKGSISSVGLFHSHQPEALASGGYVLGSEPSQALTLAPMPGGLATRGGTGAAMSWVAWGPACDLRLDGTRIHRAAEAPEDAPGLVVGSVVGLVGLCAVDLCTTGLLAS